MQKIFNELLTEVEIWRMKAVEKYPKSYHFSFFTDELKDYLSGRKQCDLLAEKNHGYDGKKDSCDGINDGYDDSSTKKFVEIFDFGCRKY